MRFHFKGQKRPRPTNRDGSLKLGPNILHAQAYIDIEELMAHWGCVPADKQTDANLHFERFYFVDDAEAARFAETLKYNGAFGRVIGRTVRVCHYWEPLVVRLIEEFETGEIGEPVEAVRYPGPGQLHTEFRYMQGFEPEVDMTDSSNSTAVFTCPENPRTRE